MAVTSTVTNTVGLTMEYDDKSTRNYTFTGMANTALANLKAQVLQFNTTVADETAGAPYKETFVSDEGSPISKISKAKYTVTEEQVIYRG